MGFVQHSKDMQTFSHFSLKIMLEISKTPLSKMDADWAAEDDEETAEALQIMARLERWLAWRVASHWDCGAAVYHPDRPCDWQGE